MADKLKYNATKIINGYKIDVKVRLDDDCRNGHADFGITATILRKGQIRCLEMVHGRVLP